MRRGGGHCGGSSGSTAGVVKALVGGDLKFFLSSAIFCLPWWGECGILKGKNILLMKTSILKKETVRGGFTLIELMVVIAILATLASVGYGPILDHMNDGDRQKANSNLKGVFTLLQQFKMDHGSYPCDATAESLQEENATTDFGELKGDTSNAYFRQLFFKSGVESEKPFFAKLSTSGLNIKTEGDEKLANGNALKAGENAMSYVMRKDPQDDKVKVAVSKSNAPLAMCSVFPSKSPYSGDKIQIDMTSFRGHFFVLSCDGSVKDLEESIEETDENDAIGVFKAGVSVFPETKRGRATATEHIVLTPES